MDNDEAGRKCEAELIDGLEKAGVPFFIFNPAGEYKDANERLVKDRPGFIEAVKYGIELEQAEREKIIAEYVKEYGSRTASRLRRRYQYGRGYSVYPYRLQRARLRIRWRAV